jgi:hypothetical protein
MYGNIEVTLVNRISLAYYVKRVFTIRYKQNQKVQLNSSMSMRFLADIVTIMRHVL